MRERGFSEIYNLVPGFVFINVYCFLMDIFPKADGRVEIAAPIIFKNLFFKPGKQ
jgi:hypothetical protein